MLQDLFDEVRRASGASAEEVTEFLACGMLINVTTALGLPELFAPLLKDHAEACDFFCHPTYRSINKKRIER